MLSDQAIAAGREIAALLIEDNAGDIGLLEAHLAGANSRQVNLHIEAKLSAGLDYLGAAPVDVVLLDLLLPDGEGMETVDAVLAAAPDVPIIVLTGTDDDELARQAIHAGAQDFLVKGQIDGDRLLRSISHAIERHRLQSELRRHLQRLRDNEQRIRRMIECLPDGALVVGIDRIVLFVNSTAERIYERSAAELVGSTFDLPIHVGRLTELQLQHGEQSLPVEMQTAEIEWDNTLAYLVTFRDLTDRQRAEATQTELRVARQIQFQLLPHGELLLPGYDIAGASFPAEAVGGDYFDYIPMRHDRVALVIGDAAGHGLGPALLMAEARACLNSLALTSDCPGEILTNANQILAETMPDNRFITLLLAKLNPHRHTLTYANAGHPPAYIFDAEGTLRSFCDHTNLPLGIKGNTRYEPSEPIRLNKGDMLFLFTDGLTDAQSRHGARFGESQIHDIARRCRHAPAREIRDALHEAVNAFQRGAPHIDDITSLIIKVEAG